MNLIKRIILSICRAVPEFIAWGYKQIPMGECVWCHRKSRLNRHHIIPQVVDPTLINVESNIVILCKDCHFVLGHRCNTHFYNPDVMDIIEKYTNNLPVKVK